MTRMTGSRGFTLIEVMVAIAIFSVVAAIAYST
ncbi:MAG: prepilin-type N-terminal cleavage/methylation domain-containing protein, partial [Pseudomonadota bacterium]